MLVLRHLILFYVEISQSYDFFFGCNDSFSMPDFKQLLKSGLNSPSLNSKHRVVIKKQGRSRTCKSENRNFIKFLKSDKTNQYVTGNKSMAYFIVLFVKLSAAL